MSVAATYPRGRASCFGAPTHREGCEHCECSTYMGDLGERSASHSVQSPHFPHGWWRVGFFRSDDLKDSL